MDCRIIWNEDGATRLVSGNDETKNALAMTRKIVLAARMRPSFATTKPVQKLNRSREEKRGERSAERRNPTIVRRANKWAQCAPLVCVRGGGAPQKTLLA